MDIQTLTMSFEEQTFQLFPQRNKSTCPTNAYTQMFIAALFVTAKNCKQSKFPSINQKVSQLWYNNTMKDCSATIKNHYRHNNMKKTSKHYAKQNEARHKRLQSICFHSQEIQKRQNYMDRSMSVIGMSQYLGKRLTE